MLRSGADIVAADVAAIVLNRKSRPFAMFRGDFRKPVRARAKPGEAGKRRLAAMVISSAHASSVAKLQRAQRILIREMATDPELAARVAKFAGAT